MKKITIFFFNLSGMHSTYMYCNICFTQYFPFESLPMHNFWELSLPPTPWLLLIVRTSPKKS